MCRMGNWRESLVVGALTIVIGLVVMANAEYDEAGITLAVLGLVLVFSGAFRWARQSDRDGLSS